MEVIDVLLLIVIISRILSRSGSNEIPGLKDRSIPPMLAKEGDINIGLLMNMATCNRFTLQCTSDPVPAGCQWLEMAIYVVDKINSRVDLLPNITLGFVAVDGCSNDLRTLEVATYLLKDDDCSSFHNRSSSQTSVAVRNGLSDEIKHHEVVAMVGMSSSRVSTMLSPLMSVYKIPIISTYATSDELSDKSRYEYFTRLVATDRYQALAVLGIARYFGWTYVSLLYTEGAYGENAFKQIDNLLRGIASSYGICIAVAIKISSLADDVEYSAIADTLILNQKARVVITFVEYGDMFQPLFNAIRKRTEAGTFIWLGADAMALTEQKSVIKDDMLEGTIFVEHSAFAMPDFNKFLISVTPENSEGNTWIQILWERKYQCVFSRNSNSTPDGKLCSMNLHLDSTICPVQPALVNRIHDGFLVIAKALHDLILDKCSEGFRDKRILMECISGDDLLRKIKETTFEGVLGTIQFNEDGDFMENLVVKQFYLADDNVRRSKTVGSWNATDYHLLINESLISWKPFNRNLSSADEHKLPVSICSLPCLDKQYIVKQSLTCCWICGDCRDNEVILGNRTGCQSCPMFTWPDEETGTTCVPIDPVYLHYSDAISIVLLCLAVLLCILAIFCIAAFLAKRDNKLVKALSIQLSMLILFGTVVVCVTAVFLVVPAGTSPWICVARNIGFHFGISLIYAPLLVKNIRIYRIFAYSQKSVRAPRWVSTKSQWVFAVILLSMQVVLVLVSEISSTSTAILKMPTIFEKYVELYCYKSTIWFLVPLAYNVLIMLFCAWIGFKTRNLPNNFNESWFIFISVATTLFAWVVFIPAYFTISNVYLQSAVLGFAMILNGFVTLIFQYLPVLYALAFVALENITTFNTMISKAGTTANAVAPSN